MATSPSDDTDSVTVETNTERYQVDFSLDKYLKNWPPTLGKDVDDAPTYGIIFLVIIGLMFTCCIIVDLDFLRRKLAQLREKKRQKEAQQTENLLRNPQQRPNRKNVRPVYVNETSPRSAEDATSPVVPRKKPAAPVYVAADVTPPGLLRKGKKARSLPSAASSSSVSSVDTVSTLAPQSSAEIGRNGRAAGQDRGQRPSSGGAATGQNLLGGGSGGLSGLRPPKIVPYRGGRSGGVGGGEGGNCEDSPPPYSSFAADNRAFQA